MLAVFFRAHSIYLFWQVPRGGHEFSGHLIADSPV